MPKTNAGYWEAKIERNVERHIRQLDELAAAGWASLTIWECELADREAISRQLRAFLDALPAGDPTAATLPL